MKRYLPLVLLLLTLLMGCRQQGDTPVEIISAATADDVSTVQQAGDPQQQAAVLSDARQLYRICTTRPQRVLPTQGSQQQRTSGKASCAVRTTYHQSFNRFYDGRYRTETAPFRFVASRDYYIIALRRILR
ncbi:MAG: hypothetical protein IJ570_02860 [Prevotella sp.]|nr:hypothetical protein [Prevotella sp.]